MITEKGFIIPTVEEIYNRKLGEFKTVKPDIRETDSNLIIPLLKFDAVEEYDSYLKGLMVFNNLNVYTATGTALNSITSLLNMTWKDSKRAHGKIVITTDKEGVIIPQAWGVETEDGKKYITLNSAELELKNGENEIDIISLEDGEDYNVSTGLITNMTQIINGITKVNNPIPTSGGAEKETDTGLRLRYLERIDRKSSFTTEGIKNYILENTNVQKCQVIENDTDDQDSQGRPPHSYEAVCLGDTDENIFNALYTYKLAGLRTYGEKKKNFKDITIGFTRAKERPLTLKIDIKAIKEIWVDKYKDSIIKLVQAYIDTVEPQGTIYLYKILGEIYKQTAGIKNISIKIGDKDKPVEEKDFTLEQKEIAVISPEEIKINVVV